MNVGASELFVAILNFLILLAVPALIVLSAILLLRRIRSLEARVASLEGKAGEEGRPAGK
jgi:hypothetical protein